MVNEYLKCIKNSGKKVQVRKLINNLIDVILNYNSKHFSDLHFSINFIISFISKESINSLGLLSLMNRYQLSATFFDVNINVINNFLVPIL